MDTKGALSGKTALITAGSGGIASGCARQLLKGGAVVVLMARTPGPLEESREQLQQEISGAKIELFAGDALKPADLQAGFAKAHAIQGSLDIVVAVAGGGGPWAPLVMQTEEACRDSIEKNVMGAFMAIKYAAPLMKRGGAIVCISSTASKISFPYMGMYGPAKAAVEMLVRNAAENLASVGIRVNAVRPGVIRARGTGRSIFPDKELVERFREQVPLLRPGIPLGEPDDIGHAVRYLAGPESSWVTGQSIAVDGGNELRMGPDITKNVIERVGQEAFDAATKSRD